MPRSRRSILATIASGSGVGFAGCGALFDSSGSTTEPTDGPASRSPTGSPGDATPTETQTETPMEIATDAPSVASVTFRAAYRYGVDDGIGVMVPDADQFAFVRLSSLSDDPPPTAFTLALGDRRISPKSSIPGFRPMTPGVEAVYTDENRAGALLFDVPTVETGEASIRYEGQALPIPAASRAIFTTAPSLELASVSAPDSVSPDERIELDVAARNVGDREGAFLAGFRSGGVPKPVTVWVPPGQTASATVTYEASAGAESMYFAFDYPGGDRSIEVRIENETHA